MMALNVQTRSPSSVARIYVHSPFLSYQAVVRVQTAAVELAAVHLVHHDEVHRANGAPLEGVASDSGESGGVDGDGVLVLHGRQQERVRPGRSTGGGL